jgi:cephalosporin-C deacetylase
MSEPFHPTAARPADFESYWQEALDELAALPIAAEEEMILLRSNEFCATFAVRYTGLGPYRLFGYLSLPQGKGPFPTLLNLPRYGSVLELISQGDASEKRGRYLIFSPAYRGQRNADRPYAASYPGLFTDGIDDPQQYLFRSVIADCCRAVDYVLTRGDVDRSRMAAVGGNDLPLFTAALRPEITHLVASPTFFHAPLDLAPQTNEYPLEEINDYLRLYPDRRAAVTNTLAYFEPRFFAPSIRVPTLLRGQPDQLAPITAQISGPVEVQPSAHSSYKDGLYEETWLAQQFGFDEPIVPAHWQNRS